MQAMLACIATWRRQGLSPEHCMRSLKLSRCGRISWQHVYEALARRPRIARRLSSLRRAEPTTPTKETNAWLAQ